VPTLPSAKKRMRQNIKRQAANRARKSRVKTQIKKFMEAVAAGDRDQAEQQYRVTAKMLDQTAAKGVIHVNEAARRKARLAKRLETV